jgi:hypothetical protein
VHLSQVNGDGDSEHRNDGHDTQDNGDDNSNYCLIIQSVSSPQC